MISLQEAEAILASKPAKDHMELVEKLEMHLDDAVRSCLRKGELFDINGELRINSWGYDTSNPTYQNAIRDVIARCAEKGWDLSIKMPVVILRRNSRSKTV